MGSAAVHVRLLPACHNPFLFYPFLSYLCQQQPHSHTLPIQRTLGTRKQGSADLAPHPIAGVDSDAMPSAMLRDSAMTPMVMPAITSCAANQQQVAIRMQTSQSRGVTEERFHDVNSDASQYTLRSMATPHRDLVVDAACTHFCPASPLVLCSQAPAPLPFAHFPPLPPFHLLSRPLPLCSQPHLPFPFLLLSPLPLPQQPPFASPPAQVPSSLRPAQLPAPFPTLLAPPPPVPFPTCLSSSPV